MAKKNGKKNTAKMESKKVMKKVPEKKAADFKPVRIMFNKILTKVKGLTLVENKHGAVQIKRSGDLLFSARKDGKMIITCPMFNKKKERISKHGGTKWDHLTHIPFGDVTLEMLLSRCKDKKSAADYHKEFYSGKKKVESGLYIKAQAAQARAAEANKKGGKIKREKAKAEKAKTSIQRQATKKPTKKPSKKGKSAIASVAAKA